MSNDQFPINQLDIGNWHLGFHWDLVLIGNYWDLNKHEETDTKRDAANWKTAFRTPRGCFG